MDGIFEDWPWSEANNYVDPASDLLDDLTFQQSSKSYHFEQQSFDWNEDLFAELDDFILFPETACEEYESFDKPSLSSHYDGETASQSSPSSSLPSSPAVSLADGPSKASAEEEQHVVVANLDNERPHRRRRTNTVFPCTLCKRVCFTSVEARRHHARHVKPFKCMEFSAFPVQSQTFSPSRSLKSPPATLSSSSEKSRCSKAFATKNELERHRKSVHYCIPAVGPKEWFKCPIIGCKVAERLWPRRDNLLVHMKQSHPESVGMELRAFIPEKDGLLLH